MDRLWAPWRIGYIRSKKKKGCIFCEAARKKKKAYVIYKTRYSIALLNTFPYNNGHVMVSPLKHTGDLGRLRDAEVLDLFQTLVKTKNLLEKSLNPDGYNIGINISKVGGAGITSHLHIHIVPRWVGDTNFMPVVSNTKVISQSLGMLYEQLNEAKTEKD